MIEETIREVKQAEAQADTLINEAKQKADQILQDAELQKKEILERARAEASDLETARMEQAHAVGQERLEKAKDDMRREAELLENLAESKVASAVDAVIQEVLNL